jgi:hypothetical protein
MKIDPHTLGLTSLTALLGVAAVGCAGADLTMPNPVITGQVMSPNKIVRAHGFSERQSHLPPDTLLDEVVIDSIDASKVCVSVSLREKGPIDLRGAETKFTSDTGTVLQPALVGVAPPSIQAYDGVVPEFTQTGVQLVCQTNSYGQTVCESHPIERWTWVPGVVRVFNTKGRLCAPNQNLVTPSTTKLALRITMPTSVPGPIMVGSNAKKAEFRWAFTNASSNTTAK